MDPKPYGFSTLDDLLQACPDAIIHNRKFDGTHVYQPKANEANQDIVEMVKLQSDRGEEKRAPRQFFSGKRNGETRGRGNYGSSFRSYSGQKAKTSDILKGTAQQFQARTALGPPKSAGRVQNLADVLRQYRSEIGKEHPQVPGRFIVTLADLQKKFLDVYALPPWGKRMTESELFKELDCPEFAGILVFWRLKEGGDVYVEEGEGASDGVKGDKEQKVKENSAPEVAVVARNQVEVVPTKLNCSMSSSCPEGSLQSGNLFSSVGDESDDSNILLEEEDMADGFFESGPGFGGGMNSRATSQAGQHHQLPPPPPSPAQIEREKFAEIASRFGAAPLSPVQQKQKPLRKPDFPATAKSDVTNFSGRSSYGFNSQDTSLEQISDSAPSPAASSRRIPAMRPIDVSFSSRSITPPNPMKVLADYVKSRGTCGYDTLPDDDKKLVNFSKDVFKGELIFTITLSTTCSVFATQPGEMLVRLVDPTIDTSTLAFTGNRLRDPLEADMRWMADTTRGMRVGRQFVTPVMFIAPRGFLQLVTREEEVDEAELKIERIGTMLREYMDEETVEIDQRQVGL
uniref:HTH OST-type domain-containing protein n=1 Tax=Caenorhabditis japonica TaxID=281687 RepID=A0A8R1DZI3_CAEJA